MKKKDVLFIIGDRNAKVGSQEIPGIGTVLSRLRLPIWASMSIILWLPLPTACRVFL